LIPINRKKRCDRADVNLSRYLWSDTVYVGVMQEVALIRRDAVIERADRYLHVDYARFGLKLMTAPECAAYRARL